MHQAALQLTCRESGSACGPVIIPVFKTGGWRVTPSPVGSTPTRFRQASHSACFFEIYCGTLTGRVVAWGGGLVAPTPAEPAFAATTFPITSPETIISTRRFSLRPAAVSLSA